MKRYKSLKYNVALKFLLVILILSSLLLVFLPLGLRNFFLEESYKTLENFQVGRYSHELQDNTVNPKTVNRLYLVKSDNNYTIVSNVKEINSTFLKTALDNLSYQKNPVKRYVYEDKHSTIYYVIHKDENQSLISFVYATYVDYYIETLYHQILLIIMIVVFLSLFISVFFANSITKPLLMINNKIKSISKDNWDDEIKITRRDEIGEIQKALEEMRQHLKTQDRIQREMFQNISHDLKTPIMIIEGYSQSVIDGYVNENQLNEVMSSIMEEAKRLEMKVKGLLYINKIEQLQLERKQLKEIDVNHLLHTAILPFESRFKHIKFILDIHSNKKLLGEFEPWRVALENIIDNMTRFAKSTIKITYYDDSLTIFNDGEKMDESVLKKIFIPYGVEQNSNFGLGLSITNKIVSMFGYKIGAFNTKSGVEFRIKSY